VSEPSTSSIDRGATDNGVAGRRTRRRDSTLGRGAGVRSGKPWPAAPLDVTFAALPDGTAPLRHVGYRAPHEDHDIHRDSSAVLVAAVPDTHAATPWRLAGEEVRGTARASGGRCARAAHVEVSRPWPAPRTIDRAGITTRSRTGSYRRSC
jgi:hypothetical protein